MKRMNMIILILISFKLFAPESDIKLDLTEHYKTIVLHREYYNDICKSRLFVHTKKQMFTFNVIEPPWKMNKKYISCIPEGEYIIKLVPPNYKYRYWHFKLIDVEGREYILIHKGSKKEHTSGCLVIEEYYEFISAMLEIANYDKLRLGNFKIIIRS